MTVAKSVLISALALAAAGTAQAVTTTNVQFQSTLGMSITTTDTGGDDGGYATGAMQYTNNLGQSFAAFCVELAQPHASNALGLQQYNIGSFAGPTSTLLQGLFSSSYANVQTDRQRAAFQIAIWEITHEADLTFDANDGSFFVLWDGTGSDGLGNIDYASTNAFIALSNSYLQAAQAYSGPAKYSVVKLSSDGYQDLAVGTLLPVPEPESYALMLGGLAAIAFIARRRRSR